MAKAMGWVVWLALAWDARWLVMVKELESVALMASGWDSAWVV
jgi:hypothetical protein